jgi:hypothetical protein
MEMGQSTSIPWITGMREFFVFLILRETTPPAEEEPI